MKKIKIALEHIERFIGIAIGSFWGLGIVIFLFGNSSNPDNRMRNIAMSIFGTAFGIALVLHANYKRKLRNRADVYMMCIADNPSAKLQDIAAAMNITAEKAASELSRLIAKDYLENIYIDSGEGRIKIVEGTGRKLHTVNKCITVKCPQCGGDNNIAEGSTGNICSYCHAAIDR